MRFSFNIGAITTKLPVPGLDQPVDFKLEGVKIESELNPSETIAYIQSAPALMREMPNLMANLRLAMESSLSDLERHLGVAEDAHQQADAPAPHDLASKLGAALERMAQKHTPESKAPTLREQIGDKVPASLLHMLEQIVPAGAHIVVVK